MDRDDFRGRVSNYERMRLDQERLNTLLAKSRELKKRSKNANNRNGQNSRPQSSNSYNNLGVSAPNPARSVSPHRTVTRSSIDDSRPHSYLDPNMFR